MRRILHDVRISLRLLAKSPGFTLLAVGVLGVGIGANAAIFSLVRGVVLRPLPYPEPERLVAVWEVNDDGLDRNGIAPPTLRDWRREQTTFQALAGYTTGYRVLEGEDEPRRVQVALVSRDFFPALGVRLPLGRAFTREEHEGLSESVVILSHDFWVRNLGSDRGVVGRTLRLGDRSPRIVGVAPRGLNLPEAAEFWLPLEPNLRFGREVRGAHILYGLGRLAPGTSPAQARSELSALSDAVEEYDHAWSAQVVPLQEEISGEARGPLLILLGAVLFLLLVASANVANLVLARTFHRERELALRAALGASRGQVVSLVLTESLLVSLLAGAAGVIVATWSLDVLLLMIPGSLPRVSEISVDPGVLLFALTVSVACGLMSGLAPALRASRGHVAAALSQDSPRSTMSRGAMRLRGGLVVAEMALTVLLLVGAGLLGKSFLEITRVDPGFRTEKLIAFDLSLPAYAYPEPLQQRSFFRNLRTELEAVTPVVSAALTRNPPVSGRNMTSPVVIEGRDPGRAPALHVQVATVSPGYFRTMGTKVVEGREFSETDDERGAPVAIVNEALAEAYFPGGPALGMRARTFFGEPAMREIVGVVEDVRHHTPAREPPPTFYVPSGQDVSSAYTVVVRTRGEEAEALSAVTEVVRRADAGLPLANLATLDELLARTVAGPRFYTQSLGAFAFLAVLLAVVGLYGVMSSSVTRRERELGIRFALGADGSDVMGIVLREALAVSAGGVVLGLLGALALTRVLESLLFGVSPNDPFVLAGGAVVALVVSLASAALPAWRASRTDPALALRA